MHWGLLAGGIETSMCFLGNAVAVLTQHPEWFARLADSPSPQAKAILEEVLRFEPVQAATVRFAAEDLELGGVSIKKGQAVNVLIASAARDEAAFESPDTFDPTRPLAKSLSFAVGPHACVGKHFTMMNAEITLRTLWQECRGVRRASDAGATIRGASFRRPQTLFLERSNQPNVRDLAGTPIGTTQ
jgi:cytochrome P450